MSISTTVRRAGPYAGNGAQTVFPFAFKVFSSADLVVTRAAGVVETVLAIIARSLPAALHETAYVVACEVTAADFVAHPEELRLLEMLRFGLKIDRLAAAAIERATRARHATA